MPRKNNAPARVPDCHPDRRHLANGLCKPCYDSIRQRQNPKRLSTAREYGRRNRAKILAKRREKDYGADETTVAALMRAQDGMCKICGTAPATDLDHNHSTGEHRSMLCGPCNRGLGHFKDNIELLQSAARYLELWRKESV